MLRGMQRERYHTLTYVCSLAITMAMGPMAPLRDTAVPSTWGIAPLLSFQVYSECCCRLAEVQFHWNSAPTLTCYIASHDAMSTPCPLFRKQCFIVVILMYNHNIWQISTDTTEA